MNQIESLVDFYKPNGDRFFFLTKVKKQSKVYIIKLGQFNIKLYLRAMFKQTWTLKKTVYLLS